LKNFVSPKIRWREIFPLDFNFLPAQNLTTGAMARLVIKTPGLQEALEIRMGVNRLGRHNDCELKIQHATISSVHCEISLSNDGVHVRDLNSTNGTFLNGDAVVEAWLMPGQELRLGDVELFVESTDVVIAIPEMKRPARTELKLPPPVAPDGSNLCPRHPNVHATFQCTHCEELLCNGCVRVMRIRGGKPLYLCVLCSNKCEPLESAQPKKRKGIIGFLDTVKLKFTQPSRR
jgi:pSer/pThr/pTyr-binding forkhead associated (FHA) protein